MDDFVAQHLAGVSRTYAIVIPMLPPELATPVGLGYLLMRIVDTLEDAPELSEAQRLARLAQLEAALEFPAAGLADALSGPIGETAAERALLRDAQVVLQRIAALPANYRGALATCARQMIAGVREFQARSGSRGRPYPAIADISELRRYCYFVAGVVGEMLCELMALALDRPALRARRDVAVELGIGLQLVNILKDAGKDAGQGRRYLPPDRLGQRRGVYVDVLQHARESLRCGVDYILALPATAPGVRAFCGLPLVWGALTLAQAEQDPSAAKIGRDVIAATVAQFQRQADDDAALRDWLVELLAAPRPAPGLSPS